MRKLRNVAVIAAISATAAIPVAFGGAAGAQDAGACGDGGVAASSSQSNVGGLIGSLIPINAQVVAPVNAPISSPGLCTSNQNSNSIGGGGGGGGSHSGVGGGGSGQSGVGGGGGGVGGASVASAVGGAPRFAG